MSAPEVAWRCAAFEELGLRELYLVLALRAEVFVVEQACAYQDVDGLDPAALHVLGTDGAGRLLAYARILPPGHRFTDASLGRVVTAPAVRRTGLGRALVIETLHQLEAAYGPTPVTISAQCYLRRFYEGFGFAAQGTPYDEDGIPHVAMRRPALGSVST